MQETNFSLRDCIRDLKSKIKLGLGTAAVKNQLAWCQSQLKKLATDSWVFDLPPLTDSIFAKTESADFQKLVKSKIHPLLPP